MGQLPSGTVTFVFTDIEGSTRLLEELGPPRYAEALAIHRRLLREAFQGRGGVEVDTQGDAFFFAFSEATAALDAAEAGQAVLAAGPIRVRIGVHTGEALVADNGYVGFDVHKGARVAAAGHGGQVVISEAARLASGRRLHPLGTHRLKDLTAPEPLWQLGVGDFPPLKTLNQSNLPVQAAPLIGRESELREAGALLREHRLVTIVGPGGSGKTRLGLQLAADALDDFSHGVWWVPLQAVRDPGLVIPTVASTLGVTGDVTSHLQGRQLLLLLDNLEQVLGAGPDLAELLASADGVRILITSREPVRIAAEMEYALGPLQEGDAIALFARHATRSDPLPAVRSICQRLDCLPLAIELAAPRTKLLTPEQLLVRLDERLSLLTGGRQDAPDRQRTLRATIEWSHDLLARNERDLFARLAVFAESFTVDAAEEVVDADLNELQSLIEKNLLRNSASGRLGMLETIGEFARERLAERSDYGSLAERHAAYFLALAETADNEFRGAEAATVVARFESEHANLRAALDWFCAIEDGHRAVRLSAALGRFWYVCGYLAEGRNRLAQVLPVAEREADDLHARVRRAGAHLAGAQGDLDEADRQLGVALELFRAAGDEAGEAATLSDLGLSESRRGRFDAAEALFEEARMRAEHAGATWVVGLALANHSYLKLRVGDYHSAAELAFASVDHASEICDPWTQAHGFQNAACALFMAGNHHDAGAAAHQALELLAPLQDKEGAANTLAVLAAIAARIEEPERAAVLVSGVQGLLADLGCGLGPLEGDLVQGAMDYSESVLGVAQFATMSARGSAMDFGELLEFAASDEK